MEYREGQIEKGVGVTLNDDQKRAQKKRSLAIALCLAGLVLVFYVATITKFGPKLMDRPIISIHTK